tara:strand:+ start:23626 stop:23835 length:210 start_codon:yes stop_codon:yes gene_type:complete
VQIEPSEFLDIVIPFDDLESGGVHDEAVAPIDLTFGLFQIAEWNDVDHSSTVHVLESVALAALDETSFG